MKLTSPVANIFFVSPGLRGWPPSLRAEVFGAGLFPARKQPLIGSLCLLGHCAFLIPNAQKARNGPADCAAAHAASTSMARA